MTAQHEPASPSLALPAPPGLSVRHAIKSPTLAALAEAALCQVTGEPPPEFEQHTPVWLHEVRWFDLLEMTDAHDEASFAPDLADDWAQQWDVATRRGDNEYRVPVAHLTAQQVQRATPIRVFSWHKNAINRSGTQWMTSTQSWAGFESRFEQSVLLALDFDQPDFVRSQPFRLHYKSQSRSSKSPVPDFFAVTADGPCVINARPASRVDEKLLEHSAALKVACERLGWDYRLVVGVRQPQFGVVSALRGAAMLPYDVLNLAAILRDRIFESPGQQFGDLVADTPAPAFARHALRHLLWQYVVTCDISVGLFDSTPLYPSPDTP